MSDIDLATQTTFAELLQRCLDADFDEQFGERGSFRKKKAKGRYYWHFQTRAGASVINKYVGPVTDPTISERVARFGEVKADYKRRKTLVRSLEAAGLPRADALSGAVVEAMWKAGFFRLRGVLVGTLAFQCYAGLLGVRLPGQSLMTQDADFAQFWGISENVGDSMPPPLQVLQAVDPTFKAVPTLNDPFVSVQYSNSVNYRVDFLTPNRGSQEHQGKPARMKAMADTGAQPLRHLDYLIHQPERSLLLYGGGVPVTIPRAERYAVHKLIVAVERANKVKSAKDIMQSEALIMALSRRRPMELAEAWETAWATGDRWREKLEAGRARLSDASRAILAELEERRLASRRRRGKT